MNNFAQPGVEDILIASVGRPQEAFPDAINAAFLRPNKSKPALSPRAPFPELLRMERSQRRRKD